MLIEIKFIFSLFLHFVFLLPKEKLVIINF